MACDEGGTWIEMGGIVGVAITHSLRNQATREGIYGIYFLIERTNDNE